MFTKKRLAGQYHKFAKSTRVKKKKTIHDNENLFTEKIKSFVACGR